MLLEKSQLMYFCSHMDVVRSIFSNNRKEVL